MDSLENSIKDLGNKLYQFYTISSRKVKKYFLTQSYKAIITLILKTDKDITRNVQTKSSHEQQKFSKKKQIEPKNVKKKKKKNVKGHPAVIKCNKAKENLTGTKTTWPNSQILK